MSECVHIQEGPPQPDRPSRGYYRSDCQCPNFKCFPPKGISPRVGSGCSLKGLASGLAECRVLRTLSLQSFVQFLPAFQICYATGWQTATLHSREVDSSGSATSQVAFSHRITCGPSLQLYMTNHLQCLSFVCPPLTEAILASPTARLKARCSLWQDPCHRKLKVQNSGCSHLL